MPSSLYSYDFVPENLVKFKIRHEVPNFDNDFFEAELETNGIQWIINITTGLMENADIRLHISNGISVEFDVQTSLAIFLEDADGGVVSKRHRFDEKLNTLAMEWPVCLACDPIGRVLVYELELAAIRKIEIPEDPMRRIGDIRLKFGQKMLVSNRMLLSINSSVFREILQNREICEIVLDDVDFVDFATLQNAIMPLREPIPSNSDLSLIR
ncbi:unnamed protein product [Caenorhabditis bovis]|uniref:BTB domain-containing protein n=1 Tax=Caenorhabditis bovis TaxID=2654633 RepID=A0A8S1ENM2_9PELO|nr:unnamed protein product [Caenorhabditis bovis]